MIKYDFHTNLGINPQILDFGDSNLGIYKILIGNTDENLVNLMTPI